MVTHTLFVLWRAVFTNGLEIDGDSIYKGPMDSGNDIAVMKVWIAENEIVSGHVLSYVSIRSVTSLLVEETVLAEDVEEPTRGPGMKYIPGTINVREKREPYHSFALEEQYISEYGVRTLFGLTYRGEWTHMRYEVQPGWGSRMVEHARQNGGNFFFDVGNRVTVTANELERVTKEFGIW